MSRPPGTHITPGFEDVGALVEGMQERLKVIEQQQQPPDKTRLFCINTVGAVDDGVDGGITNLWVPWRGRIVLDWVTVTSINGLEDDLAFTALRSGEVAFDWAGPTGATFVRAGADGVAWGPSDTLQLTVSGVLGADCMVQLWFRGYGGGALQWSDNDGGGIG